MANEKQNILKSLLPPALIILLLWLIKLGEIITQTDLHHLGIYPLKLEGLTGIITAPLVHGDIKHLSANSVPLFVLAACLLYFYREIAIKTAIIIYIITGICVWVGGRESWHIGASGVVYGLAGFLFFSGIFRRDSRLLAITMLVTFLYGGLVWGVFPDFFPEENISYESHFWGLVTGSILAFYFRREGPKKKKYLWEIEEEIDEQQRLIQEKNNSNSVLINYVEPDSEHH